MRHQILREYVRRVLLEGDPSTPSPASGGNADTPTEIIFDLGDISAAPLPNSMSADELKAYVEDFKKFVNKIDSDLRAATDYFGSPAIRWRMLAKDSDFVGVKVLKSAVDFDLKYSKARLPAATSYVCCVMNDSLDNVTNFILKNLGIPWETIVDSIKEFVYDVSQSFDALFENKSVLRRHRDALMLEGDPIGFGRRGPGSSSPSEPVKVALSNIKLDDVVPDDDDMKSVIDWTRTAADDVEEPPPQFLKTPLDTARDYVKQMWARLPSSEEVKRILGAKSPAERAALEKAYFQKRGFEKWQAEHVFGEMKKVIKVRYDALVKEEIELLLAAKRPITKRVYARAGRKIVSLFQPIIKAGQWAVKIENLPKEIAALAAGAGGDALLAFIADVLLPSYISTQVTSSTLAYAGVLSGFLGEMVFGWSIGEILGVLGLIALTIAADVVLLFVWDSYFDWLSSWGPGAGHVTSYIGLSEDDVLKLTEIPQYLSKNSATAIKDVSRPFGTIADVFSEPQIIGKATQIQSQLAQLSGAVSRRDDAMPHLAQLSVLLPAYQLIASK